MAPVPAVVFTVRLGVTVRMPWPRIEAVSAKRRSAAEVSFAQPRAGGNPPFLPDSLESLESGDTTSRGCKIFHSETLQAKYLKDRLCGHFEGIARNRMGSTVLTSSGLNVSWFATFIIAGVSMAPTVGGSADWRVGNVR